MRKFLAFLKKEFIHISRDYRTALILFGIPIVQILLFGFAITNELNSAKIAILDKSKDDMTFKITQKLISSGYFKLEKNLTNSKEIIKIFRSTQIKEVIIFGDNFERNFYSGKDAEIELILDSTNPNTAHLLKSYTMAIIRDFQISLLPTKTSAMQGIKTEVKMLYNPELKGVYMSIPGLMAIILMLISALMTSIAIVREKEIGTMEILLASPLKPMQIILGKVLPYSLLAFVNAVSILVLAIWVFDVKVIGSIWLLLGESGLFIMTTLALGIMFSTIAKSQQMAIMLSLVSLQLPTIILSGFIYPIDGMPKILQIASNFIPAKWFVIIIKNIMLKGVGLNYIWKENLVLIGMTLFFILVSIKKFKIRL